MMIDFAHWIKWLPWVLAVIGGMLLWIAITKLNTYLKKLLRPFKKGRKYRCRVLAIVDGDTIDCRRLFYFGQSQRMRLAYVDAPESKQQFGEEAQKYLKKMLQGRIVTLNVADMDRYGRVVADVYLGRESVSETLIKDGIAWVYADYVRHPKRLKHLNELQDDAKKRKRGLWKHSRPMNPKEYRSR